MGLQATVVWMLLRHSNSSSNRCYKTRTQQHLVLQTQVLSVWVVGSLILKTQPRVPLPTQISSTSWIQWATTPCNKIRTTTISPLSRAKCSHSWHLIKCHGSSNNNSKIAVQVWLNLLLITGLILLPPHINNQLRTKPRSLHKANSPLTWDWWMTTLLESLRSRTAYSSVTSLVLR